MSFIEVHELSAGYDRRTVIKNISFNLRQGEILTLLGANGEGKTTLLKTVCGLKKTQKGEVKVFGRSLNTISKKELAKYMAYVPQTHQSGIDLRVRDMVVLGRIGLGNMLSKPNKDDYYLADKALELLGLSFMLNQSCNELSGGEQRLVLIARALVQDTAFIFLDEPVSNLDLGNQIKVLKVLEELSKNGIGIMMTSHFPDHSLWLDARTAILQYGTITKQGRAERVLTSSLLSSLYGTPIDVIDNKGALYCRPGFIKINKEVCESTSLKI